MPSRQRLWQLKAMSEGRCSICNKPRDCPSTTFCSVCLTKRRIRYRKKSGFNPRRPGGRGRPPLTHDDGGPIISSPTD